MVVDAAAAVGSGGERAAADGKGNGEGGDRRAVASVVAHAGIPAPTTVLAGSGEGVKGRLSMCLHMGWGRGGGARGLKGSGATGRSGVGSMATAKPMAVEVAVVVL